MFSNKELIEITPEDAPHEEPTQDDIADILARGADEVIADKQSAAQPTAQHPGLESALPKKRGRPRKNPLPGEPGAVNNSELDALFSPDAIGAIWVNGWNAFYSFCGAEQLTGDEAKMHKKVFANWCKHRLPTASSEYQPDILLAATVAMSMLPRMKPIAETTAPWWKRAFQRVFKRKESE